VSNSSRDAILERIRSVENEAGAGRAADYSALPRTYIRAVEMDEAERLQMFVERLHEYDAGVHSASAETLPDVIAAVLSERGKRRLAVPRGLPVSWLPPGFEFVQADRLSPLQIDAFDGIVSGCTAGIALTGSLVLQNAPAQGPRALSLVPDYHLCIVFAVQVVATVPEAFDRLAASSKLPTTFISGPSATADIEMTRIKGVHGPRFLDVILVA
jgi:L-lactate dehydrogenase complex protein LldG